VTELHELFNELADGPAPPSSFDAEQTFRTGRRRRYRRRGALIAATALAAAVAAGMGAVASTDRPNTPTPAADASARSEPRPDATSPDNIVQWAGAADARHLYLAYLHCTGTPCRKDAFDLVGSDDGGHTWTTRVEAIQVFDWHVVGAGALIGTDAHGLVASTDGGRTWSALSTGSEPAGWVPQDGIVACRPAGERQSCQLSTVNLADRRVAPLAVQPPVAADPAGVQDVGGRILVAGTDPATGTAALATSTDRGRGWTVEHFGGAADGTPTVATAEDGPVYVSVGQTVYRDGRRLDTTDLPGGRTPNWSFVAADGTDVICVSGAACRFWAPGPDGHYRPLVLDGLPAQVALIRRAPDGSYYTHGSGPDQGLYLSPDGLHWSRVS
jgi:hypothetical protein